MATLPERPDCKDSANGRRAGVRREALHFGVCCATEPAVRLGIRAQCGRNVALEYSLRRPEEALGTALGFAHPDSLFQSSTRRPGLHRKSAYRTLPITFSDWHTAAFRREF